MVGGVGLLRLPDFFTRCHGAGITDTMGAGLVLTGLMAQSLLPIAEHGWEILSTPTPNPLLLCFKVALLGISPPCLKAGCKLIGSCGWQPGVLRRAALGKHLEMLVAEDAVLEARGSKSLTRPQLIEACLDRGFGSDACSDAQLRSLLDEWLRVHAHAAAAAKAAGTPLEPHRLRLAAMAACAAASVRSERQSLSVLPRLVYAR